MAKKITAKKKSTKLNKSKKVNPYLIGIGAIIVAIVGALVVGMSFASMFRWPSAPSSTNGCGTTAFDWRSAPHPVLKQGSRSTCVKTLQTGLKNAGFMSKNQASDGVFGSKTGDSVLLLQTYYGLRTKDKVVGNCTWYALQKANWVSGTKDIASVRKYVDQQQHTCL